MDITSASQQFAVAEQKSIAYGRKQQLLSNDTPPAPAVTGADTQALSEDDLTAEDGSQFNAYQTFGMVKRILQQISKHTEDWLSGDDLPAPEKAKATSQDNITFEASFSREFASLQVSQLQQQNGQSVVTEWELGYQAVQASFSGSLQLQNGDSVSFDFEFSMQVSWARYSQVTQQAEDPLVVSLDGTAAKFSGGHTHFDLFSNGSTVPLPQLAAQQFYLAYDRNRDAQVNDGSELFGPKTGQGYAELAQYDENGNGFIDPGDDIWQYLYLWRPKQAMQNMTEAKLGAFSVSSAATPMPILDSSQKQTGEIQRSGLAFTTDAKPVLVQQIDLVV